MTLVSGRALEVQGSAQGVDFGSVLQHPAFGRSLMSHALYYLHRPCNVIAVCGYLIFILEDPNDKMSYPKMHATLLVFHRTLIDPESFLIVPLQIPYGLLVERS